MAWAQSLQWGGWLIMPRCLLRQAQICLLLRLGLHRVAARLSGGCRLVCLKSYVCQKNERLNRNQSE